MKEQKQPNYLLYTIIAILIIGKVWYEIYNWDTPYEIVHYLPKTTVHTGEYTTNREQFYFFLKSICVMTIIFIVFYLYEKFSKKE